MRGRWFNAGHRRSEVSDKGGTRSGMWRAFPCRGSDEQLFAIGDVHGQSAALAAVLQAISDCPRDGRPRHLIFLGDLIDRGPDSLGAVRLAMDARRLARVDQVTILPGNHELMLLDGLLDPDTYMADWLDNGGDAVIKEADPGCTARKLSDLADIVRSAFDPDFLRRMTEGPTWYQSGDLLFVHAGLQPGVDPVTFLTQPRFWAEGAHWAWIREPFLNWRGGWGPEGAWIVIHGHTPVLTKRAGLSQFETVADLISSHRRLCLDAGPAYGVGQVSWAEFGSDRYRLSLTQAPEKPFSDLLGPL